jgi:nitroimidazol reductase NimA-like FMN-containing flavoprotein (pyridoxamine 5'-phosphate oxidase superfamily)
MPDVLATVPVPKLTDAEVEEVLRREGIVRVATNGAGGSPLLVPVAFLFRDSQILLTARARVAWLENIRRDPRVCACVDEPVYPLRKVTVTGEARIVFEPGRDDEWRDLRLPLADDSTAVPEEDVPGREWSYDAAYRLITADEPRALVSISLDGSEVTSWRLPVEGELLDRSWAARYYEHQPRRFRVVKSSRRMSEVRVVSE